MDANGAAKSVTFKDPANSLPSLPATLDINTRLGSGIDEIGRQRALPRISESWEGPSLVTSVFNMKIAG